MPRIKTITNASGLVKFKKGQKLFISGPAEFPFAIETVVLSDTGRDNRRYRSMSFTRLGIPGRKTTPKSAMILHGWCDVTNHTIELPRSLGLDYLSRLHSDFAVNIEPHK